MSDDKSANHKEEDKESDVGRDNKDHDEPNDIENDERQWCSDVQECELEESISLRCNSLLFDSSDGTEEDVSVRDNEYVNSRNWNKKNIKTKDIDFLNLVSSPWGTHVPYKYIRVTKRKKGNYRKGVEYNAEDEYDENCARKNYHYRKKERGIWEILRDKRKRFFRGMEGREPNEARKYNIFQNYDKEKDYYEESDMDNIDENISKARTKKRRVHKDYESSMEDRLLRDMNADLLARLDKMKEETQRQTTVSAACSCLNKDKLTAVQTENKDEYEELTHEGDSSHNQEFKLENKGLLYKLEDELERNYQEQWFDAEVLRKRRHKFLQNCKVGGLAKVCVNFRQVNEYAEECRSMEDSVMLDQCHFVLPHKIIQHPWLKKNITYEEFEKIEKEKVAAAYAKYSMSSPYQKTLAKVKKLGKRYENLFVMRLKKTVSKYWKVTDKIVLEDWLYVCPLLMHGNNVIMIKQHAIPQFHKSDMNVLFKCWLEIGPLVNVLLLHHRICQWICLLDDPTWCVREVINFMKTHAKITRKRVNRISSPQPKLAQRNIKYVTKKYEKELWQKLIHEMYLRGRDDMNQFMVSEADVNKIQEPLPHDKLNKIVDYADPVHRQLTILKSFLKNVRRHMN